MLTPHRRTRVPLRGPLVGAANLRIVWKFLSLLITWLQGRSKHFNIRHSGQPDSRQGCTTPLRPASHGAQIGDKTGKRFFYHAAILLQNRPGDHDSSSNDNCHSLNLRIQSATFRTLFSLDFPSLLLRRHQNLSIRATCFAMDAPEEQTPFAAVSAHTSRLQMVRRVISHLD